MDRNVGRSTTDQRPWLAKHSPEVVLSGGSSYETLLRWLQNRAGSTGLLTMVLDGSRKLGIWPVTMMNRRRWNELDGEANRTRRCGPGGGMSYSGEWTRWWCLLQGWGRRGEGGREAVTDGSVEHH
jgi:hypothetical protein